MLEILFFVFERSVMLTRLNVFDQKYNKNSLKSRITVFCLNIF